MLLVRHADREPGMDQLSTAGIEGAQRLANVLADAGVTAIYQTQYERTQQTAAPLAASIGLTPIQLDAGDSDAVARDIRKHRLGQSVLVVGHSNTVPAVVKALGGAVISDFAEDDFGNLLVLQRCDCFVERVRLTRLRY